MACSLCTDPASVTTPLVVLTATPSKRFISLASSFSLMLAVTAAVRDGLGEAGVADLQPVVDADDAAHRREARRLRLLGIPRVDRPLNVATPFGDRDLDWVVLEIGIFFSRVWISDTCVRTGPPPGSGCARAVATAPSESTQSATSPQPPFSTPRSVF